MLLRRQDKNLIHRYLVWCYKTTKESLDKIDRYYTQLQVDEFILKHLRNKKIKDAAYAHLVDSFEEYMLKKKKNVDKQKYADEAQAILRSDYVYLTNRFLAIEKAIVHFLGKKQLAVIENLYEKEMTLRILQTREHT